MTWVDFPNLLPLHSPTDLPPLLATANQPANEAANEPLILAGVLLSLVVVYLASKLGGELCARIDLPPVLGELVSGVLIGVSA
ncbi:MAG: cation:proton antiporter, partial [Leptodesmis sp.]